MDFLQQRLGQSLLQFLLQAATHPVCMGEAIGGGHIAGGEQGMAGGMAGGRAHIAGGEQGAAIGITIGGGCGDAQQDD